MVTQQRQPLLQTPLCVDVTSNKPSKEDRKEDAEDDPLDYDTFLDGLLALLFIKLHISDKDVRLCTRNYRIHRTEPSHRKTHNSLAFPKPYLRICLQQSNVYRVAVSAIQCGTASRMYSGTDKLGRRATEAVDNVCNRCVQVVYLVQGLRRCGCVYRSSG